jgi:S-disulfanyl-L-cysteine oxidoreductase SoxD
MRLMAHSTGATILLAAGLTGGLLRSAVAQPTLQQPSTTAAGSQVRSVWDAVYTLDQAKRGALKSGLCVECHGDGFIGGLAPELADAAFATSWNGRTVGDLFDLIRLTMPDNDPGSLSREVYADLVAYILAVNKFPSGQTEIPIEIEPLKLIRIEASKP